MKSNMVEKLSKMSKGKINEKNAKYVLGGFVALIILLIAIIILAVRGNGNTEAKDSTNGVMETVVEGTAESSSDSDIIENIVAEDMPLEENAYPEINDLVERYFKAMADGDIDTVVSLKDPVSDMERLTIEAKSMYIESYDNIIVYTKPGFEKDSKIAFVYNEFHFYNIETTAAAIYTMYACKNEAGEYYFYDGEFEGDQYEYIRLIREQEDVQDLFKRVDVKFHEAVDADSELAAMLSQLPDAIKEKMGEAFAQMNTAETTEEQEVSTETESVQDTREMDFESVRATDSVNVRAAASEDANKVGKLAKGDIVKRTETLENGWSAIEYEGNVCYVKSDYLAVSSITYKDGSVDNLSGKAVPTTTINVRSSASENADKIGVANQGEELTILEVLENGWTKVEYNGKEAYVKTEYLQY